MSHLPTLGACSALKAFPGSVTSRLGGGGGYGVTRGSLSSAGASASDEQGPGSIEKIQDLALLLKIYRDNFLPRKINQSIVGNPNSQATRIMINTGHREMGLVLAGH